MTSGKIAVNKIQKFCTHDGPGVRTTVFLKGCPLRCVWCHNPETQSPAPEIFYTPARCIGCGACAAVCPVGAQLLEDGLHSFHRERCLRCMRCVDVCSSEAIEPCSRDMTAEEILAIVKQDRAFYGNKGGMTLSGGEPLFHPGAALMLLRGAKEAGLSTTVETCGCFDSSILEELTPLVDLFLWDVKDTDEQRHRRYTGASVNAIRENLLRADALGARTRLRCILVRTVNMEDAHYKGIASCFHSLRHCEGVELLPYHAYGSSKATQLGRNEPGHTDWIPSNEDVQSVRRRLRALGVRVRLH